MYHQLFFLNKLNGPFSQPADVKASGVLYFARNFYIDVSAEVKIGCWHILPKSLTEKHGEQEEVGFEALLGQKDSGYAVVVYCHGNGFDRAQGHRVDLYNLLAENDFHVITTDYRGYGDSTGWPSEEGLAEDVAAVLRYVGELSGSEVYLWGHSMGAAIAIKALADLDQKAGGLILESAFNNLDDVVRQHPLTVPLRLLPSSWFDRVCTTPMKAAGLQMDNDARLKRVECPVLQLHARDDGVIAFELAEKLNKAAGEANIDISFVDFASDRGFGHNHICRAAELGEIVKKFIEKCREKAAERESSA